MNMLEKRIKRLEDEQKRGLMAFYPADDQWLPVQCDSEGRLKGV